jgi:hypothetical protein
MADDLDAFFDVDEFAVTAAVAGVSVYGLFDRPHAEDIEVSGYSPALYCKTSDVSAAVEGDAVTVNGTDYTVIGIEDDGTGVTKLILREAS